MRVDLYMGTAEVRAHLADSPTARALAARMPLTVRMGVSSVGCCGQLPFSLPCEKGAVHRGWSNGDLNYKPEGDWIALFYGDEENSARYGGQVTLGYAEVEPSALRDLADTVDVRIERADEEGRGAWPSR